MKAYPANCIQKQAKVKARGNGKSIIINNRAQVIKTNPGKNTCHNIADDVQADMYAWLLQIKK